MGCGNPATAMSPLPSTTADTTDAISAALGPRSASAKTRSAGAIFRALAIPVATAAPFPTVFAIRITVAPASFALAEVRSRDPSSTTITQSAAEHWRSAATLWPTLGSSLSAGTIATLGCTTFPPARAGPPVLEAVRIPRGHLQAPAPSPHCQAQSQHRKPRLRATPFQADSRTCRLPRPTGP